jgi:hypothetical protein
MYRGIPEVICSTLQDAGLPDGSLHAAGCFDLLEHIGDDSAFVGELCRLMLPGSILYGTVPAGRMLWSGSDVDAGHYRRYSRNTLGKLLEPGFETLYLSGLFSVFTVPLFLTRVIPWRLGLGRLMGGPSLEREHGIDAGAAVTALYRRLSGELEAIRDGRAVRGGTSLLFAAARK